MTVLLVGCANGPGYRPRLPVRGRETDRIRENVGKVDGFDDTARRSLQSLLEVLATFEREASCLLERFGVDVARPAEVWRAVGAVGDELSRWLGSALGLADEAGLDAVRAEVRGLVAEVARIRERDGGLANGLAALEERCERFEKALEDLSAANDKLAARMDRLIECRHRLETVVLERRHRLAAVAELNEGLGRLETAANVVVADSGLRIGDRTPAAGGSRPQVRSGNLRHFGKRAHGTTAPALD